MDEPFSPRIVAIGASGGEGMNDIITLLRALRKPVRAVVMVVLHRPSDRVSRLREVLAHSCGMPIVIAAPAGRLAPGVCYIGEPASHLTLMAAQKANMLHGTGHVMRGRTIDALFESLAVHAGRHAIGIVLSGSLDDGSRGLAAIHQAHGMTMVLDPGHKPRGMQQNAIDFDGPINLVGTSREIAEAVGRLVAGDALEWPRVQRPPAQAVRS